MRGIFAAAIAVMAVLITSGVTEAHDDPIVTVRVLTNGFNVLDMDAVLGEIADTATLSVDRPVHGPSEIEAWVRDQMDHDLRIEIVDIGSPQRLADGYTLSWTARFSREDWRRAGIANREVSNAITIHNGRITEWNASLAPLGAETPASQQAQAAIPQTASAPVAVATPGSAPSGVPEVFGVPLTLVVAVVVLAFGGVWITRRLVH